ncbi:MAG: S41 family peptidase [Pirellulaceae bacterium]
MRRNSMRKSRMIVAGNHLLIMLACVVACGTRCWALETQAAETQAAETQAAETQAAETQELPAAVVSVPPLASPEQLAEERELIRLLADTLEQVRANYVDSAVSERELIEAAIEGMITKLDPYSDYIAPQELDQFRKGVEREFVGIGVQVAERDGQLQIISPLYGTPAWRAGLRAGDRILKIGEASTQDLSLHDAIELMTGEAGTEVTVSVLHPDQSQAQTVTLKRELIQQPTVIGYRRHADGVWDYFCDASDKIGYLRVAAFSRNTTEDLQHALQKLQSEHMQALVLDLRFNPGGMLTQAIETSDLFLHEGRIVSVAGRATDERAWDATAEGTLIPIGFPIAVLVNRFSASAAEIVAACLQDNQVAVIVGERTWGKGSVQNIIELEEGKSALKLTTAGYRRPSGKNIHRAAGAAESEEWGVKPDAGYDVAFTNSDMVNLGHRFAQLDALTEQPLMDSEATPADSSTPIEFVDRQLEKSLEYLRDRIHSVTPQTPDAIAPEKPGALPPEPVGT